MSKLLRIVIYGSESTGKTTLARDLADYYHTVWVPEYSREYLQKKLDDTGKICEYIDLMPIALGQLELEDRLAAKAQNNLLFCDTNILQTYYYGKAYYENFQHEALWKLIQSRTYDFYFLTQTDVPWQADDLRDRPHKRKEMHNLFENSLKENKLPYITLEGSRSERLNKAIIKVNQLIKKASK